MAWRWKVWRFSPPTNWDPKSRLVTSAANVESPVPTRSLEQEEHPEVAMRATSTSQRPDTTPQLAQSGPRRLAPDVKVRTGWTLRRVPRGSGLHCRETGDARFETAADQRSVRCSGAGGGTDR